MARYVLLPAGTSATVVVAVCSRFKISRRYVSRDASSQYCLAG